MQYPAEPDSYSYAGPKLQHVNLVRVYDFDIHEGRPFLAMELVRGRTLYQRAQQQPYAPKEAAAVVAAVAKAVAYLHGQGIVHQDIKPKNIMIDAEGHPRLIDLGLARLRDFWSDGEDDPVGGTLAYIPPEQLLGKVEQIGPAADVFTLGGVLYFLLTGVPPNVGHTRLQVLERARKGLADRDALKAPGIPRRLAKICQKALDNDPAKRPSAEKLAEELDRFTSGFSRRIALVALAIPLVAIGGWWILPHGPTANPVRTTANPLRAGSTWAGTYFWTSDLNETKHPIQLKVTGQQGDGFSGVYETREDNDSYVFQVEGSVHGDAIQWRFRAQIAGKLQPNVVKEARVEGTINGNDDMFVHYIEGADKAIISMQKVKRP